MSEQAIAPPWPQDRYEVSYAFPGRPAVRERYHFASVAIDFARHLALAGLAQKIRVTRLADAAVLYDSAELIELPERQW